MNRLDFDPYLARWIDHICAKLTSLKIWCDGVHWHILKEETN